jgi:hypothetical protein
MNSLRSRLTEEVAVPTATQATAPAPTANQEINSSDFTDLVSAEQNN